MDDLQENQAAEVQEGGEPSLAEEFEELLDAESSEDKDVREEASAQAQEPAEDAEKEEGKPAQEEQPEPEQGLTAPTWWNDAEKEAWGKTPPDVQKAIASRIRQVEAFAAQTAQKQQLGDAMSPIAQAIAKHGDFLRSASLGGKPLAGNPEAIAAEVDSLFQLKELSFSDPQRFVHEVSRLFAENGVDFQQLVAEIGRDSRWNDPEVSKTQRELAELKAWKEQQDRERQQVQHGQYMQGLAQGIVNMSDAKDSDGNRLFPELHGEHGQQVGMLMGRFLKANAQGGHITNELFQQAYEVAVYGYQPTRDALIRAREEQRVREFQERSARARKARGVVPHNAVGSGGDESSTLDQALDSVWAKHMGE